MRSHATPESTPGQVADLRGRALRDLRISVTDRCNFRCEYCMPKDVFGRDYRFLAREKLLRYAEIEILVRAFIRLGVRKIRITGGEPLLRGDLERLIARLAKLQTLQEIALTTNASLLSRERARALRQAGVRRINVSLDALDETIYARINRIPSPLHEVLRGIEHALEAGFDAVKVNMVVQKGVNHSEILPMAKRFRGSGAILRFIEFMDVGNHNQWSPSQVFSAREIIQRIDAVYPLEPLEANYHGEVAKRWRYADGKGEIGVIASITEPFCDGCARARLSAAGELYTCLFATRGMDLRKFLRAHAAKKSEPNNADLEDLLVQKIATRWQRRSDQYSKQRATLPPPSRTASQKVEMSYIGG